jgi:hypothetical protein
MIEGPEIFDDGARLAFRGGLVSIASYHSIGVRLLVGVINGVR